MPTDPRPRVRRLLAGDRARWQQLFQGYIDFYKARVPDDVVTLTWSRVVAPNPTFIGLGAVDAADQVQGFAIALLHPSTWSPTCYCYLEDLFVDPAARGQGIGRALVEAVYEAADRAGATRTYWVTEEGNPARVLYDRLAKLSPYVQYRR